MKITLITTLTSLEENERIAKEAKSLGHNFQIIDLGDFGFEIGKNGLEVPQLKNFKADVVILRGVFNSIKTISVIIDGFRKNGVRVFDNNFLEHRYSIDKVTDLVKLSLAGISVPRTSYSRLFDDYPGRAQKIGYPVVVKSSRKGKGASVFKVESEVKLKKLISELEDDEQQAKSYIMQEFIPYKYDLRCLVIGKNVFTMRRIPGEGEFRANFSLGGSVELFDLDEDGKNLAIKALNTIDMSVGGVDILITDEGKRYILEVNHTAGFVGMEKATGVNIGKIFVEHTIASAR